MQLQPEKIRNPSFYMISSELSPSRETHVPNVFIIFLCFDWANSPISFPLIINQEIMFQKHSCEKVAFQLGLLFLSKRSKIDTLQ